MGLSVFGPALVTACPSINCHSASPFISAAGLSSLADQNLLLYFSSVCICFLCTYAVCRTPLVRIPLIRTSPCRASLSLSRYFGTPSGVNLISLVKSFRLASPVGPQVASSRPCMFVSPVLLRFFAFSFTFTLAMPSCSTRGLPFLVHRRTRRAASKEVLTWSFVSCSILLGLQCIRTHRSVDFNMALVELSGAGRQFRTSYLVNTCIPFFHTSANVSTLLWP